MGWNIGFDVAAIILLLMITIWYLVEKRIPLKSHKVYLVLLFTAYTATGLELFTAQLAKNTGSMDSALFQWTFSIQTVALYMVNTVLFWYILVIAHVDLSRKKGFRILAIISIVVNLIVNLLNPILQWAYYFEDGLYTLAPASLAFLATHSVLMVMSIVIIFKNVRKVKLSTTIILLFSIMFCVFAIMYQIFVNNLILCFAISIVCLTFYHYMHNPGSMTDSVTKLFNRNFMGVYMRNDFAERKKFGIIVLAMDDFKFINKTYGVEVGDQLLFQVGSYLREKKSTELVFRLGSDQFCIVIKKDLDQIDAVAEKILERFRHPWFSETYAGIMMSASLCCIECPTDADSYENLIEVIDYSMAIAKKTKKGSVSRAAELELNKMQNDKAIEKAIRLAMDRGELMVYYQPIFSIEDNVYNSAEALVRLNDEELGWISPEVFIPIAEKNGLIVEMGDMILESVCRFIHDNKLEENGIKYIEVNISPLQLVQIDFVDRVKRILEKYEVKPSQINMEITETATIGAMSIVNENIGELVDYGIKFSLDDYGSGNSNIDYINHMPFSIIKLDKYIVWDAFKSDRAGITLEYTIGMLNALQLYIVAEGVETAEMRDQLAKIGCHYLQGWYYSKAVSDQEFMQLLAQK